MKAVMQAKAQKGQRANGLTPYGYVIDPENKHHLIPDTETAPVVKQIFSMYVQGAKITDIQDWLMENEIPVVTELMYRRKGKDRHKRPTPEMMYSWPSKTIYDILGRLEYRGHTVTAKSYKVSYKSSRVRKNPEEKQYFFPNTHEPLIDEATWELAQKRIATRTRPTKAEGIDLFSGLIYCADCKYKMYAIRPTARQNRANAYICSNFRNRTRNGIKCKPHYISQAILSKLVLTDLQRVLTFVREHESDFIRKATENGNTETLKALESNRRELDKATARMREIDTVFKKLYEDNALGRVSEEQFVSLTSGFDDEKAALKQKQTNLEREISNVEQRNTDADKFVKIVKNYTDIQELTYENVHAFIDKIFVHAHDPEIDTRKIEIHYSFVGQIDSGEEPTKGLYLTHKMKKIEWGRVLL